MRLQGFCAAALALSSAAYSGASAHQSNTSDTEVPVLPDAAPAPMEEEETAAAGPIPCCTVPADAVIELEIVDPASSRTSKIGEKIRIRVAEPVLVDGRTAIPAGTEGYAEVIQASKARMMGKAGELTLGIPYLELRGQRITLKRLRYGRASGHDATLETTIATAAVGPIGMVITGGNVDIQSGAQANARVAAEITITPDQ